MAAGKQCGEVTEWSKVHAWRACVVATLPWVRIPPSPPDGFQAEAARRERRAVDRCEYGEVPEWSIGAVSKTVVPVRVPWVRIPPSPPEIIGRERGARPASDGKKGGRQ